MRKLFFLVLVLHLSPTLAFGEAFGWQETTFAGIQPNAQKNHDQKIECRVKDQFGAPLLGQVNPAQKKCSVLVYGEEAVHDAFEVFYPNPTAEPVYLAKQTVVYEVRVHFVKPEYEYSKIKEGEVNYLTGGKTVRRYGLESPIFFNDKSESSVVSTAIFRLNQKPADGDFLQVAEQKIPVAEILNPNSPPIARIEIKEKQQYQIVINRNFARDATEIEVLDKQGK